MEDVAFLVKRGRVTPDEIEAGISAAVIPQLPELQEAFEKAKTRVLELVQQKS